MEERARERVVGVEEGGFFSKVVEGLGEKFGGITRNLNFFFYGGELLKKSVG